MHGARADRGGTQGRRVMLARARRRSNSRRPSRRARPRAPRCRPRPTVSAPGHGRVRISGPSSVMAMVCSAWAARRPSAVTTVHWSSRSAVSAPAGADHGLDGVGLAGAELAALARLAPVGDVGLLVHGQADAVAGVLPHHREPGRLGHRWTAAPMSDRRPPGVHGGDAGRERRLGDLDEARRLGVDRPHPGGEGGVAVPALDDGAAVDRDDVALLRARRARGCRARSRRSARRRSRPGTAGGRSRGSWSGRRGAR